MESQFHAMESLFHPMESPFHAMESLFHAMELSFHPMESQILDEGRLPRKDAAPSDALPYLRVERARFYAYGSS